MADGHLAQFEEAIANYLFNRVAYLQSALPWHSRESHEQQARRELCESFEGAIVRPIP